MQPLVFIASFFGVLPVSNVLQNVQFVQFKPYTFKVFLFVLFLIAAAVETTFAGLKVRGISFNTLGSFMFYLTTTTDCILFFRLATRYGDLIRKWQEKETCFLTEPYYVRGRSLKFRVRSVGYFMMVVFVGL